VSPHLNIRSSVDYFISGNENYCTFGAPHPPACISPVLEARLRRDGSDDLIALPDSSRVTGPRSFRGDASPTFPSLHITYVESEVEKP